MRAVYAVPGTPKHRCHCVADASTLRLGKPRRQFRQLTRVRQSDQFISVGEMVFVQSAVRVTGHVLARCRHGRPASAAAQRTIDARAESTTTSYSYYSSICLPRKGASVISSRRRRKVRLPASLSAPSSQVRRQPNCTCPRQTSLPRHST